MNPKIVTVGVYGFTEDEFFQRLVGAGVNVFCDIRARRGVRGAKYAFVNSRRLQARLAELGIGYVHVKELAPPEHVREVQRRVDSAGAVKKRVRTVLSSEFIDAYRATCLSTFDARAFVDGVNSGAGTLALFCVERDPKACHRSIVADQLREDLGLEVEHIL